MCCTRLLTKLLYLTSLQWEHVGFPIILLTNRQTYWMEEHNLAARGNKALYKIPWNRNMFFMLLLPTLSSHRKPHASLFDFSWRLDLILCAVFGGCAGEYVLFAELAVCVCVCVCRQGAARGLLRQQREAAALSAGDHRMADSQGRGAVGAAAHRRRRGGRPAPEGVPPGNVDGDASGAQILMGWKLYSVWGEINSQRVSTYRRYMTQKHTLTQIDETVDARKSWHTVRRCIHRGIVCSRRTPAAVQCTPSINLHPYKSNLKNGWRLCTRVVHNHLRKKPKVGRTAVIWGCAGGGVKRGWVYCCWDS